MTFFEAWEKAEEGEELRMEVVGVSFKKKPNEFLGDIFHDLKWGQLFRKEWTIIPQKKTVTIDIEKLPQNGTNICVEHEIFTDGSIVYHIPTKITYELPSE
jgi:hypothetical protein